MAKLNVQAFYTNFQTRNFFLKINCFVIATHLILEMIKCRMHRRIKAIKENYMKLQLCYTCDVCDETSQIDFENSFRKNRLECPHCGVNYHFSERDFVKFNKSYNELLQRINSVTKENFNEVEPVAQLK